MAYSKSLAARIRQAVAWRQGVTEKKMFGGIGFLLQGNMLVAVWLEFLILRLGVDQAREALTQDYVRVFDLTGRPMKGWVMVEPDGIESERQLTEWIERAVEFVSTLAPK